MCGDFQPAFADHGGAWLPGDMMSYPAQARMVTNGEVRYCMDGVAAAYPNAKSQAAETTAFATGKGAMPARLVSPGSGCDTYIQAPTHAAFVTLCGAGAYGCIYYWHDPVDVYIDLQGPNGYYYNNSTFCHEGINTGHDMGLNEEYHDHWDTGDVYSNGRTWTCMDYGVAQPGDALGRNVWALPDWDRDRIFNEFVPDAPAHVGLTVKNGWANVTWDQNRKDGGVAHANGIVANSSATLMGFGHSDCDGCPITNVADICGPTYGYCASPFKSGARSFDTFWAGCLYVRAWNAGFGNVLQVSAPNYWTLAGCWEVPAAISQSFPGRPDPERGLHSVG